MAERRPHVCIVGAGISGLRCAEKLLSSGFQVTILEARNRIGGRICQSDALGYTVDLGPNWIHAWTDSDEPHPIFKLAQDTQTPVHYWNNKQLIFDSEGNALPAELGERLSTLLWEIIEDAFNVSEAAHKADGGKSIDAGDSLYDHVKREAARRLEDPNEQKLLIQMSEMWGAYVGEPVWKQSLRFAWMEECCGGIEMFVESNYSQILDRCSAPAMSSAEIRLNTYVTHIDTPGDLVTVMTADGNCLTFDQIVVSTPLGWLKRNLASFSPPLPPTISSAITNLGLSQLEKVYITFSSVFWTSNPQADVFPCYANWLTPAYATETNPIGWPQEIWDLSTFKPPNNHPTLLFYLYGDCSRHIVDLVHDKPDDEKYRLLDDFFRPYYSRLPGFEPNSAACRPIRILASEWARDELSGGASYCNFPVGSQSADQDVLAFRAGCEERRLWFCGEHAAPFDECGTVAGAYLSGQKAAENILTSMSSNYRLGVDVGGTFTDVLLLKVDTGQTWRTKISSTPEDQSLGVRAGIDKVLNQIPDGSNIVLQVVNHGTTIATNALLEGQGAKVNATCIIFVVFIVQLPFQVALVVTEGYRDILQTRRSQVPGGELKEVPNLDQMANSHAKASQAPGRISTEGHQVRPFEPVIFRERVRELAKQKPEAITVSLINSFANPVQYVALSLMVPHLAHSFSEHAALQIISEIMPDVPVSLSSDVLPEVMEYERAVTTVCNSYLKPTVDTYLHHLLASLQGKTEHLRILRSDGGLSSVALATRYPVTLALSGPAGGVSGVVTSIAAQTKYKNLITLDMGGTSTDVALIQNATPQLRRETHIADIVVVRSPCVDVRTVGAGGGSIAHVPKVTKSLRVGPESAGAVPGLHLATNLSPFTNGSGPACYGKGGPATVSDANAVLGFLPEFLLGGSFRLDLDAARSAVQKTADDLGLSLFEAAAGIVRIANETMLGALRLVSIEQGYDPRDFSLVAFGGAGPLHANALGVLLHTFPVIIPPSPGVLCAWGDATTRLRHEESRTFIRNLSVTESEEILTGYAELLVKAQSIMLEEQGVSNDSQVCKYQADLRYLGQAITIPVDVQPAQIKDNAICHLTSLFEFAHEQAFTFKLSSPIELINLRIIVEETLPDFRLQPLERAETIEPSESLIVTRTTLICSGIHYHDSPIWMRTLLKWGHIVHGTASNVLALSLKWTAIHCSIPSPYRLSRFTFNRVLPGYKAEVDEVGNLLIWESSEASQAKNDSEDDAELDTVMVDIFESALRNARNEMDTVMIRASMSPAIREQVDEFNVIAEPGGKMIVGQFGSFIGQFLERWKGPIEEGDIFLVNDPYSVGGSISHLNDWLIVLPVYSEDSKLIAWCSNFGHMTDTGQLLVLRHAKYLTQTDTGGSVPGSLPTGAMSVFEEGLQIPITKICSRGVWNEQLMELIYRNVRLPEWNRCDTAALVAACTLAGRRMKQLYERFGDANYFAIISELLERNRRAIGTLIQHVIPDEDVYFFDYIDDDGRGTGPWKVACTMYKQDGILNFDFTGTDPQSPSSINYVLSHNMFKMFVGIYLITVYDPPCVVNDGFHDLIKIHIPEGTLLNPVRPAALSTRTHLLGRVMDLLSGLLGQKNPQYLTAGGFSDSPHFMYSGYRENGRWFQLYQIGFGGVPARPHGDGMDGTSLWPAMKSVPNEFLELYFPLRIEEYCTVTDSGGAGLFRGGNGQRICYRFLEPGEISLHDDRWLLKPFGVMGGEPGGRSSKVLVHYSSGRREILPSKQDHIKVEQGDVLEWQTWGGGGYGDPLLRDAKLVALEVHRGLVSFEGAKRYGVVVLPDFSVDDAATNCLRSQMAGTRQSNRLDVFNRGGTVAELCSKAFEETGLHRPRPVGEVPLRGPMTGLPHIRAWMKAHGQIK
ncbi:putative hydantoin utilization protein [Mycena indigotica]|uniref:Putative hydantoin utilization protein n=1 Tax=Mycena indigotica TaxID=2126181 RepID=A0A8H6T8M7_9AGAR|nr:putative hydantoin utilization protein [Mycena indigotica]KAF7312236.1 putative hydantoin utilization protein [Mycena indigotica]